MLNNTPELDSTSGGECISPNSLVTTGTFIPVVIYKLLFVFVKLILMGLTSPVKVPFLLYHGSLKLFIKSVS